MALAAAAAAAAAAAGVGHEGVGAACAGRPGPCRCDGALGDVAVLASAVAASGVSKAPSQLAVDAFKAIPLSADVEAASAGEDRATSGREGSASRERRVDCTLVLMRHGESMWNDLKLFTGDVDIPLTERGVMEAMAGGRAVAEIDFDMIFTSRLVRSKQTALLAMTQSSHKRVPVIVRGGYHGKGKAGDENRIRLRHAAAQALEQAACRMIPVYADPALNERCYGDLQGLNKEAATREYGAEQVMEWRRSTTTRPPHGESLLDTAERTLAFFKLTIEPRLKEGNNVLVVAHGNVLRCIIAHLSGLKPVEMLQLQVATALPYTYAFNGSSFAPCCVLTPINPETKKPVAGLPQGIASVMMKGQADSLI
eukprot:SM000106S13962  [mRNA]  locus=s106:202805:205358:+ [translate_table: standard]